MALQKIVQRTDGKFLVGPVVNGWISVFPEEDQTEAVSADIAKVLLTDIFQFMVHDDDIFMYWFYRNGKLVDHYNSCPEYFEGMAGVNVSEEEKHECSGRPELFQDLLKAPGSLPKLEELLAATKKNYAFESQRMAEFVELLGLTNTLSSYRYLQGGEQDDIEGWDRFQHLEKQPDPAEDIYKSGKEKHKNNDLDGALADYNRVIEINPNAAEAWNNRGRVKRAKGDLAGALADFNRAIEIEPGFADAYTNRGLVKKARNDPGGAMADYNKAIELKPGSATAHTNRGNLKRMTGDLDGALADYSKAIELNPEGALAWNNRGNVKRAQSDLPGALADYEKAIELKPDFAEASINRDAVKRAKT